MGKGFAQPKTKEKLGSSSHSSPVTSIDKLTTNLINYFEDIPDPRTPRTKKHLLQDILAIAVLAVIAGAEDWEDIENYGISKQQWLKEFLELPNGIPSKDFEGVELGYDQRIETGHHRREKRRVWASKYYYPSFVISGKNLV